MQIAHLFVLPVSLQPVLRPSLYNRGVRNVRWTAFFDAGRKKSLARWYYFNH
jgi:hypothetical protein